MATKEIATFANDVVQFAYPVSWTREVDESDDGVAVTLQSPGVTFAIVGIYHAELDPEDLVEQAVESLREEHPSLEVEEVLGKSKGEHVEMEAIFISLDVVSYCWLRSWRLAEASLLVMVQSIEPEAKTGKAIFNAICRSVETVS